MYLGIDLGTSGVKAVLIDRDGALVGTAHSEILVSNPQPLWSEQEPEDWWLATCRACQQLAVAFPQQTAELKRIGLSGQMHGATLLDEQGKVLRPCILWNDGRSESQCQALTSSVDDFHERSGNLAMPGFTAPKVLWVAEHEPEVYAATKKILLPKDYLCYRLTGLFRSDMSDAAGTLWLNPEQRDWDDALLAATGIDRSYMPELLEGCDEAGLLTGEAAEALQLPQVPVTIGGGDNACGAIGVGVTEPGQAFISLGTSGVVFVVSDGHRASPENTVHAFCHALPQRWHQMSVSLSAANSLSWFANLVDRTVPELLEELTHTGIDETSVIFLPYLSGERTPHNNPEACGQLFGLRNETSRAEMTLAVLEGVAFSFADGLQALNAANSPVDDITLIGGGARSAMWRQMISDVLNRSLTFRDGGEVGPGLGAARLAHLTDYRNEPPAVFNQKVAEICPPPALVATHQPNTDRQQYFSTKLERFRALYLQTRSLL